jgi:hypothetical protein
VNAVREQRGPTPLLMAIYRYPGANWRQAIRLCFHPIADCHQVLCDTVAQKGHQLAIHDAHPGIP